MNTESDIYFGCETPITDRETVTFTQNYHRNGQYVPAVIAYQLERELHAALKRATTEAVKTMRPASIEDKVIDRIRERQATGRAKYGTTMERTDLDLGQWLQHLQEELLDAAVYVEKLKGETQIIWNRITSAPLDKRVLLYDSGDIYTAFYSPETKRWMCSHYDSPTPSHWAPLPKGPLP